MELKPCPFCGNKKQPVAVPVTLGFGKEHSLDPWFLETMVCQNCSAQSPSILLREDDPNRLHALMESWNERKGDE